MPTKFRKVMKLTLVNTECTFVYIDVILIVTKDSKDIHMQKVKEVMKKLGNATLQLKVKKGNVASEKVELLRYEL